ncbi:hypothetical protein CYPRO_0036 [Cyclonatronum proteinivorum]|uniref:Uncharacterized protein n=1 Tax=Cyclonatronum proteinivorum TaxID=1457365 RepID=A0A345UFS3_9BACT|nr:hypothetical protein CYPRO_0036 [Cyclonatronum proteinivorum]
MTGERLAIHTVWQPAKALFELDSKGFIFESYTKDCPFYFPPCGRVYAGL